MCAVVTEISEQYDEDGMKESLDVIRRSFATVAASLNLNVDNAPTHAAFTTMERLQALHKRAAFFGLYAAGKQVGFVAAEMGQDGVYYLDKLAVLPENRHRSYGAQLVSFIFDYARTRGGTKVALGMIDSMDLLKDWYRKFGFKETGTKKFEHLPFIVCFMEKELSA